MNNRKREKTFDDIPYDDALFHLKITAGCIYTVLDATLSMGISIVDEKLNQSYISLIYLLDVALEKKDFKTLREKRPEFLPDHLLENIQELSIWWLEFGEEQMMNFYGAIEKAFVLNGKYIPKFILKVEQDFINDTVAYATKHKKKKEQAYEQMMQNADEARGKIEENEKKREIKLSKAKIIDFNPLTSTLIVDDKRIIIAPSTFEFCLCKLMFDVETREPVEWKDVYEETHDPTSPIDSNSWRQVYDTMGRVNKILQKELNSKEKLFLWKNKTVMRLF